MKIYTYCNNPFRMGGPQYDVIATEIQEYERVDLGKGFFGVVVKNSVKKMWHIADEVSGALVGTDKSRKALIKKTIADVECADVETMRGQQEHFKDVGKKAIVFNNEDFFKRFRMV